MASPAYTHDLTTFATADESTGWAEFTGINYGAQSTPSTQDADYPIIQGQYAVVQQCRKTGIGSIGYAGTGGSHGTDGAYLMWHVYSNNQNIDTYGNGGFRCVVGDSYTVFDSWDVGGSDKSPYPYGGWTCHVVNTTVTPDDVSGTPTGQEDTIGVAVNLIAGSSKGEPHAIDAIRYGRCSSIFSAGDSGTPATFSGFSTRNDAGGNRWGLIQESAGGYLWQGRMQIGDTPAASACRFEDSNVNILIKWTPKVTRNFNMIEIINSNSYVDWDGITFQVLDTTTASNGWFRMTDPATLYLTNCTFIDMDRFIFNYSSNPVEITSTIFRRCGYIIQNEATFDGCTFSESPSAIFMYVDDISLIKNSTFVSDATGHAIELTTDHAGNSYTFDGNTFSDYASANGSTGNEAIYNNSGGAVTINLTNTDSVPSYRNGAGASTIINLTVTLTLSGIVSGSEVRIQEARGSAPSGAELYHIETTDGTDVEWAFNYSDYGAGYYIDIIIHNPLYTYLRIDNVLLPSTNSTIPIQQELDRWYNNP